MQTRIVVEKASAALHKGRKVIVPVQAGQITKEVLEPLPVTGKLTFEMPANGWACQLDKNLKPEMVFTTIGSITSAAGNRIENVIVTLVIK